MCDENAVAETLASCPGLGGITLCPCGTISLHVGGVSVRMEPAAFMQMSRMCHEAMLLLNGQLRDRASTNANAITH
ncbi:hypothetical protein [Edaphobacter flagellatus]|uniref:hypothetical protein n=1 Tax=Edaphobacter flagellatus TaxID=1933044 RepID=UPI0021B35E3C|nr:hypothetical protein [Edaphobacter flagellatus]